jgi:hypothetical protein
VFGVWGLNFRKKINKTNLNCFPQKKSQEMDSFDPTSEMHHSKVGHMKDLIKNQFEYTYLDARDSVPKIFVPTPKKKVLPSINGPNHKRKGFQETFRHFKIPEHHPDPQSRLSKQETPFVPHQRISPASFSIPPPTLKKLRKRDSRG